MIYDQKCIIYSHMIGCESEFLGVLSDTIIKNTERASSTVTARPIFSPLATGSQNTSNEITIISITGVIMFNP